MKKLLKRTLSLLLAFALVLGFFSGISLETFAEGQGSKQSENGVEETQEATQPQEPETQSPETREPETPGTEAPDAEKQDDGNQDDAGSHGLQGEQDASLQNGNGGAIKRGGGTAMRQAPPARASSLISGTIPPACPPAATTV